MAAIVSGSAGYLVTVRAGSLLGCVVRCRLGRPSTGGWVVLAYDVVEGVATVSSAAARGSCSTAKSPDGASVEEEG
ncbi:MAG: hypothetical protein INR71_08715 [Terriglobus roseus]|nr:hypothetical protein [Terriglobus roseus]